MALGSHLKYRGHLRGHRREVRRWQLQQLLRRSHLRFLLLRREWTDGNQIAVPLMGTLQGYRGVEPLLLQHIVEIIFFIPVEFLLIALQKF